MQVETTALLIDADALPSSLEEQLAKRDVMAEYALISEMGQMLAVVAPDLVVVSSNSDVASALRELRASEEKAPIVVLADRAALRELREEGHPEISALIPADLPVAAMAHRLASMSRMSAAGKPLSERKQPTRPQGTATVKPKSLTPRPKQAADPLASTFAFQEIKIFETSDDADEIVEKISDREAKRREEREARERERTQEAQKREESQRKALERKQALLRMKEEEKRAQAAEERRAAELKAAELKAAELKAAELKAEERKAAELKAAELRRAQTEQAQRIAQEQRAQAQRAQAQRAQAQRAQAQRAQAKANETATKTSEDELSVIMPLPVNLRLPLQVSEEELPPIRLALLDTDLTRADAIAAALREKGMVLQPVTPEIGTTRWPLLRRFAPQGLIVDEKSMARSAAEWVETFRGDLFLRHVPLIVYRFSQLFREATGEVTLAGLLPLVDHLGREENVLLDKLRPGRQVDLQLSQVPPFRLVQMLTGEDRNTRLDCRSGNERVVWHLGPGYAGSAKLVNAETGQILARLSAEEAFLWLLRHEDSQVAVHEHTEPLAHASQSVDSARLLRELTEAMGTPSRHQSVRPGDAPLSPSLLVERRPSSDEPVEMASQNRAARLLMEFRPHLLRGKDALLTGSKTLLQGYRSLSTRALFPLQGKLPDSALRLLAPALPLLVLFGVLFLLWPNKESSTATAIEEGEKAVKVIEKPGHLAPGKGPAPEENPAKAEDAPTTETKEDASEKEGENLWVVAPDKNLPSCEVQLGAAAPAKEDSVKSMGYWKNARQLLMVGKSAEAFENMCLAGLYDPNGPAAEGLAEYYLGQRSLKEADRWVRISLATDSSRRRSQELLGDISSQKGEAEEAKRIWLETMKLKGDETRKLTTTARKFVQDAKLAMRSGDLPRAERTIRRAAALAPEDATIALDFSDILLRRSATEGAGRWAAQALKLDPDFSAAKLLAGRIAEALGRKDEARAHYESVPLGDPFHSQAQNRRGQL